MAVLKTIETKRCTGCAKNRQLRFYSTPRARVCNDCKKASRRKSGRKSHLSKTYGIEQEEYEALKEAGDGTCWICHGPRPYHLPVDHDHIMEQMVGSRGSVRGLLCKRCNKLLRDVGDNIVILKEAVHYLMTGRIRAQAILNPDKRLN